jgi:hypothetical protein
MQDSMKEYGTSHLHNGPNPTFSKSILVVGADHTKTKTKISIINPITFSPREE